MRTESSSSMPLLSSRTSFTFSTPVIFTSLYSSQEVKRMQAISDEKKETTFFILRIHFSIIFEKIRNGLNAFEVIENPVVLIGRMDSIRIEAEPHENGFQTQFFFEQCNDRNASAFACGNRFFAECGFHGLARSFVRDGIGWRYHRVATVMRGHFYFYRFWCDALNMFG